MTILKVIGLAMLVLMLGLVPASPAAAATCTCVTYMQAKYSLPTGGGAAADYGSTLLNNGYQKLLGPAVGATMIFARGAYGASSTDGHMAYITSVGYDSSTSEAIIVVNHAKWTHGTIISGIAPCTAYGDVRTTTFRVKKPYSGLSFYRK